MAFIIGTIVSSADSNVVLIDKKQQSRGNGAEHEYIERRCAIEVSSLHQHHDYPAVADYRHCALLVESQ